MIKSIANLFGKIIGSKADRDLAEIRPLVDKINVIYPTLASLSNDELRKKTTTFRADIQSAIQPERDEITALNARAESETDMDFSEKEILFDSIDKIKKKIHEKIEVKLLEILPEAFAVMRETARRFTENPTCSQQAS
jgi:preprotein translocase subunit SecA